MYKSMFLEDDSDYIRRFAECEENYYSRAEASIAIIESLIEYMKHYIVLFGPFFPSTHQNKEIYFLKRTKI